MVGCLITEYSENIIQTVIMYINLIVLLKSLRINELQRESATVLQQ